MNHEEATTYLDDLGARVPDRRPPIGEIIRAAKIAERRRAQRTKTVIAAAVALIAGGGWTLQPWSAQNGTGVDEGTATTPTSLTTPSFPGKAPANRNPCPSMPATHDIERSTVPAPEDAEGLTANAAGTVASWFEPTSGPLPFLVVYDLVSDVELAREDLGVGEDLRSMSLRMDDRALYYKSSADPDVWLRYRWGVDDYPSFYNVCTG